uniref:General transcription factor IIF subunit 2 n=1 Tax=Syphacia muris TaxID=451379 RepID=A0A0N5AZ69_9BILA
MSFGNGKKRPSDLVDCELAKRGVWLVKVPRYLSDIWEKNAGRDVGRLIIKPGDGKTEIIFKINHSIAAEESKNAAEASTSASTNGNNSGGGTVPVFKPLGSKHKTASPGIPEEHSFIISDLKSQTMAVLLEDKSGLNEESELRSGRLSLEGRVVKRADCRPPRSEVYLKMKINQIERSSQPKRHVKQIDKAEVKFKPVAIHAESLAREKQKKEGAKTVRADKDLVRQAIFHAFEKHQYYRLVDLQKLTNQPPGYVKEILMEIAQYNTVPPHKSMWELKPEYRSYGNKTSAE